MRALILAAGRGSRLGESADGTPKCLLEVGRRRMIEHQLMTLAEAGVAPVAMVIGYGADEVRDAVGIRAEYILNRRWEQTNSVYSFWLAREWLSGPVVILNCDVLFHPEVLSRLLAVKGDALAYDSQSGSAPEHMKVAVRDGRVVDMAKDLAAEDTAGENLGVLCFSAETVKALVAHAGQVIEAGGENSWLSSAVRQIAKERPIRGVDVAGLPWAEIDSAYDLEHARKKVWPLIAASRRRPPLLRRLARVSRNAVLPGALVAAFLGYEGLLHPGDRAGWDTVELRGLEKTELMVGTAKQAWWKLDPGGFGEVQLEGPGPVRVESRLLLPPALRDPDARVPYVLRVEMDGRVIDLVRHVASPDPGVPRGARSTGKRRRLQLQVPPGRHVLRVSLLGTSAQGAECVVRVRGPEPEEDEPDAEPAFFEDEPDFAAR